MASEFPIPVPASRVMFLAAMTESEVCSMEPPAIRVVWPNRLVTGPSRIISWLDWTIMVPSNPPANSMRMG